MLEQLNYLQENDKIDSIILLKMARLAKASVRLLFGGGLATSLGAIQIDYSVAASPFAKILLGSAAPPPKMSSTNKKNTPHIAIPPAT